jgi:hypothetical protein
MPGVDEIPVAHTPPGGWKGEMPPAVLSGCNEPLTPGAPDLRGLWRVETVDMNGAPAPSGHRLYGMLQRIEQAGDRMVVTGAGVIHDMRCDGTAQNGVNDVAERDFTTRITVAATYEDGVHVLRPVGIPIEVTRRLDGAEMVWTYPGFVARLRRIEQPAGNYCI